MLTSLYGGGSRTDVKYFFNHDDKRAMYCDAILSAEACSKYILANHRIDEIIVLGSKATFDAGDELVQMVLREGSSFYVSDTEHLSAYSMLRYRLAQYIDEIRIEEQDLRDLLSEEEQKKAVSFLRTFFREHIQHDREVKHNRFFDVLMQDADLRKLLRSEMKEKLPESQEDPDRYDAWVWDYLYSELKATSKLELLEGNENVTIRFIPSDVDDTLAFAYRLNEGFKGVLELNEGYQDIDLYVCIQSEDANDTETLMNFMDIVKTVPDNTVRIKAIATATLSVDGQVNEISDKTDLYEVSDLLTGCRAFMKYGKTDLLSEYWYKHQIHNDYIEKLLYAMRNIDYGISLCDINDMERGINSLRHLFTEGHYEAGNSLIEQYFALIIDSIKQDYGRLVTGDGVEFIDLVKWVYRKGFWQQTLTIIESRAPDDMVARGIFYYADSAESKDRALSVFAGIYNDLKPFEKYKLDHIGHYFVKFYGRDRADRAPDSDGRQQSYVRLRMSDLDADDPEIMRAYTVCPDREALGNLLYTYNMVGMVRNETNHATNNDVNEFSSKPADEDVSERMNTIRRSVEEFIERYELVLSLVEDKDPHVVHINNSEIRALAGVIKPRSGAMSHESGKRHNEKDEEKGKPEEMNAENTPK